MLCRLTKSANHRIVLQTVTRRRMSVPTRLRKMLRAIHDAAGRLWLVPPSPPIPVIPVPTIRPPSGKAPLQRPTIATKPGRPDRPGTGQRRMVGAASRVVPRRAWPAEASAIAFLRWAHQHRLAREWMVDDLWYLASEDFAPALDVVLPPRRVFLGALQREAGVTVTYDRRLYTRNGRLRGKTTFYQLNAAAPAIREGTRPPLTRNRAA